jgi:hypothetical protein
MKTHGTDIDPKEATDWLKKLSSNVLDELSPHVRWYILDENNKPVRATIRQWSAWRVSQPKNFHVGQTDKGKVRVSTVFLGLDHGHSLNPDAPPVLFETMIFDLKPRAKKLEDRMKARNYQTRCCTWEDALEMHKAACVVAWEPKIV